LCNKKKLWYKKYKKKSINGAMLRVNRWLNIKFTDGWKKNNKYIPSLIPIDQKLKTKVVIAVKSD